MLPFDVTAMAIGVEIVTGPGGKCASRHEPSVLRIAAQVGRIFKVASVQNDAKVENDVEIEMITQR